jgi:hypothetical protein
MDSMTDRNQQKGYVEPDKNSQWERTSHNQDEPLQTSDNESVDTSGDSSEIEDVQEDGTVAVGSGLGIDE